ncbi:MAG: dihydroorotate dehydrogenase [Firmicutes bacterium]|uniref:Dihydroorotate dehydrogenase n=1 Tax=Candidatus Gallilactobacillus intestinavium TaxID=2840838 RepID=A0A9D9H8I4_9LACO|nr:dihydroorotate dehydrogenase [Candidatus Gallilactobacillus intestinavium]
MSNNNNRLAVKLPGLDMKNPLMPASGTFGFGDTAITKKIDLNKLGAMVIKTVTREERVGNPQPQISVINNGVLNSVGLAGPGVEVVVNEKIPQIHQQYPDLPIVASVAGGDVEEYVEVAEQLSKAPINMLEVNVSCPNIKNGGLSFGTDPNLVSEITQKIKDKVNQLPVYVKLTPNVTNVVQIAKAAEKGGADGLSMINTVLGMHIDVKTGKPSLGNVMGGLSGEAIKPIAIRMIYQVAQEVDLPIIGMGGVSNAEGVIEMFMAGASAVAIGSAHFKDEHVIEHIVETLPQLMDDLKIDSLQQLHEKVRRSFQ